VFSGRVSLAREFDVDNALVCELAADEYSKSQEGTGTGLAQAADETGHGIYRPTRTTPHLSCPKPELTPKWGAHEPRRVTRYP
jgi:hypothetical protein